MAELLSIDSRPERIAILTDFGAGPYVGQMQLRLSALAPTVPTVSLIADLAPFRPDLAGYLIPGLMHEMPGGTLYCCVVDPGVGSDRGVLVVRLDADWLVAPDNGLLVPLLHQGPTAVVFRVLWRPRRLSASFHGRDLFAPLAARLTAGQLPPHQRIDHGSVVATDWPAERAAVCHIDAFGNLMTGLRADGLAADTVIVAGSRALPHARTFSDVAAGEAFWYRNAFGLVEIAVNQGSARAALGLDLGAEVSLA